MNPQRWFLPALLLAAAVGAASGCSRSAQSYVERGDAQLAQDNVDAAVLEYRNAVQKDPRLATARQKLAEAYIRQGIPGEAVGEFVRAADLLPTDEPAQLKAGRFLFAAGRFDDAKLRAEKALAINPGSAEAMTLRANAMFRLKDLDGAITQLRAALARDPSAGRHANLGVMLAEKGLTAEAEAAFRDAIAADPASVESQLAFAQYLSRANRLSEAETALKGALSADPRNLPANAALADFYIASKRAAEAEPYLKRLAEAGGDLVPNLALADYYVVMNRDADALAVLERLSASPKAWAVARSRTAALLYMDGKAADGHRAIDEVIAKYPSYAQARVIRARFLIAERRMDQARAEAAEAVKADPRNADAHFALGVAQEARNDAASAVASFNEVLRLSPRSAPAQVRLASLELRRREFGAAARLAEQATQQDPANLEAQLLLARALLEQGSLDRAAGATRALVERFPQSGAAHAQAGAVALRRGDRAVARASFEKALALDPALLEPLASLVALDIADKQGARARARMEARLRAAPNDSGALLVAGRVWASTGDLPKAEQFLRRAIDANPANFEAYQLLAAFYVSQQRLDEALAQYEKLIARQPAATGPQTMAALIVEAQGKKTEARQRYERIVQADPRAAVASNNLAWMLASQGEQLDRALQLAQAARAALPESPAVADTLAYVYIKKQLGSLAVPLLTQAIATQASENPPGEPSHFYHLGLAYMQTGAKAEARQALEQALKLKADFEGADEARRVLATLR